MQSLVHKGIRTFLTTYGKPIHGEFLRSREETFLAMTISLLV